MNYNEVLEQARGQMGAVCKACPECNGRACNNHIPGPGAKGVGDTAMRNYDAWKNIRINLDTISDNTAVSSEAELFGQKFVMPVFAGPVGAVKLHYGDKYDDLTYNVDMINACKEEGIAAFTGDGVNEAVFREACTTIKAAGGMGVPTCKPWNKELVFEKINMAKDAGAFALAMDIDAAGLPFLKGMTPPAGRKNVAELKEIADAAGVPFILKGVMTVKGALKACEAGASAIIVSNHGGRVLDQCAASAEVLPEIVDAVGDKLTVLVDGGIRSGTDVFKALAIGAKGVIICRPFVVAAYGAGQEGIKAYINKIKSELVDTMEMCGAHSIDEISRDMIRL